MMTERDRWTVVSILSLIAMVVLTVLLIRALVHSGAGQTRLPKQTARSLR